MMEWKKKTEGKKKSVVNDILETAILTIYFIHADLEFSAALLCNIPSAIIHTTFIRRASKVVVRSWITAT